MRMHNIGPTQIEIDGHPHATAWGDNQTGEYGGTGEVAEAGEFGEVGELGEVGEAISPFNEIQEVELASELLEVTSEAELEQFLGSVLSRVAGAARQLARSGTGRALGGILKD